MSTFFSESSSSSFPDFLASKLRIDVALRVYHVCSPATTCPAIFATLPDQEKEDLTTCESHFLGVSQPSQGDHGVNGSLGIDSQRKNGDTSELNPDGQVLVFGIEVLIFDSPSLTTIFVSKADSTGFLQGRTVSASVNRASGSPSIIKVVTSTFLEWLVLQRLSLQGQGTRSSSGNILRFSLHGKEKDEDQRDVEAGARQPIRKRLVLSLFARSQNQYLFPGSIENEAKHVLDDRQLVKWWCRVLDDLVQKKWSVQKRSVIADSHVPITLPSTTSENAETTEHYSTDISPEAFLIVPGCDRLETKRLFLPPSARSSISSSKNSSLWSVSYPIQLLNRKSSTSKSPPPVRCMIPRLPDDPKARFCDDLDDSGVDEAKEWKAIKTLDQFWEMMSYRQECSAGRLVGFVWVVFDLPQQDVVVEENGHREDKAMTMNQQVGVQNSTAKFVHENAEAISHGTQVPNNDQEKPISGTVRNDSTKSNIILSPEDYNKLANYMINDSDFAGLDLGKKSTHEWIAKIKEITGFNDVGVIVHGKAALPREEFANNAMDAASTTVSELQQEPAADTALGAKVNMLVGVRKRKRDKEVDGTGEIQILPSHSSVANTTVGEHPATSNQVNGNEGGTILSAGLVRKKPKPVQS